MLNDLEKTHRDTPCHPRGEGWGCRWIGATVPMISFDCIPHTHIGSGYSYLRTSDGLSRRVSSCPSGRAGQHRPLDRIVRSSVWSS